MKYSTVVVALLIAFVLGLALACNNSEESNDSIESKEVFWYLGNTTVYANITAPTGNGPHPAVLFIAGSGPTDRDWNSPLLQGTNGSGKLLAKKLVSEGYVTLRYDKRFTGEHASDNLPYLIGNISMQSHLNEVISAVDYLVGQPDIDASNIFVLTNSEGAIHALNYQLQSQDNRFAGMILTGIPGRSIMELAESQIAALLDGYENKDELMALYNESVADFMAGRPVAPDPALPADIEWFLRGLDNEVNLPFSRELWSYDTTEKLKHIPEPMLVMIGKKDLQVDWEIDGARLQEAVLPEQDVTFMYPDNANHVLKYEEKPRDELNPAVDGATYNLVDRVLDTDSVNAILEWLLLH